MAICILFRCPSLPYYDLIFVKIMTGCFRFHSVSVLVPLSNRVAFSLLKRFSVYICRVNYLLMGRSLRDKLGRAVGLEKN